MSEPTVQIDRTCPSVGLVSWKRSQHWGEGHLHVSEATASRIAQREWPDSFLLRWYASDDFARGTYVIREATARLLAACENFYLHASDLKWVESEGRNEVLMVMVKSDNTEKEWLQKIPELEKITGVRFRVVTATFRVYFLGSDKGVALTAPVCGIISEHLFRDHMHARISRWMRGENAYKRHYYFSEAERETFFQALNAGLAEAGVKEDHRGEKELI